MQVYSIAAACVIFVCSFILFLIYRRKNSRSSWAILFIAIASLISAISVPALYGYISKSDGTIFGLSKPEYLATAVIVLFLAIVLLLSLAISYIVSKIMSPKAVNQPDEPLGETVYDDSGALQQAEQAANPQAAGQQAGNKGSYLEQIFQKFEIEHNREISNNDEKAENTEINIEKSVDRSEIIDKMGIENIGQTSENLGVGESLSPDEGLVVGEGMGLEESAGFGENIGLGDDSGLDGSLSISENLGHEEGLSFGENPDVDENLTLDECIEKAFSLKENRDLESAILYFMYALDKKPGKELAFWIVLDICVMYKELGQREMAFDILNGYYEIYGDVMGASVKEEIEKNLRDETFEPVI